MGSKDVRVISGYGPQENWNLEEQKSFFRALEGENIKAKSNDKLVYMQLDAHSKLGPNIITHYQRVNRKFLAEILQQKNAIYVINSVKEKYSGKYTRRRNT